MASDGIEIQRFDKVGNLPECWRSQADGLLTASRLLMSHGQHKPDKPIDESASDNWAVVPPALMLAGFGIECLLKALWVKQGNKLAVTGRYVGVKGANDHDLLQLATVVRLRLTPTQKDVLKRLSVFMVSIGRYPIPRHWSARKMQRSPNGGRASPEHWVTPKDNHTLYKIIELLKTKID